MFSDAEIFIFILIIILLIVIRITLSSNKSKGNAGEYYTEKKLHSMNKKKFCGYILRNIYIPKSENKTSEIDLIYITEKGIFVIESKNYSGYIFGKQEFKNWTQTLYNPKTKKVEKYHFYNPIWQNNNHIKILKEYLNIADLPVYSIIVFSERCELKNINYSSPNTYVIKRSNLRRTVSQIWESNDSTLNSDNLCTIYNTLLPLTSISDDMKKKHIKDIYDDYDSNNKCPICGGDLILRTAKSGPYAGNQFYGCSNYPKCHYTKNLN